MERSLITWSVPNMITIWLMFLGLLVIYAVGAQVAMRAGWVSGGNTSANSAGGY